MSFNSWRVDSIENVTKRVKVGFVGTCGTSYCGEDTGIPMIRTTNLTDKGIDYADLKFVTKEFHEKNKKSQLHRNDILVARHGDNGKACLYNSDIEANCLNVVIIEPDAKKMLPRFLKYLFDSRVIKEQVTGAVVGSVQNVVNTKTIAKIQVPVPQLPIQQRITSILSSLDDKIENNRKTFDKLEEIAQAIFKRWFVEFEFPNEEGLPYKSNAGEMVYCDELGKEIPKGWAFGNLNSIGSIVGGSTPSKSNDDYYLNGTIPWITPKDLSGFSGVFISIGECSITKEGYDSCSTQLLPKGSVLYSSRAPIGYIAINSREVCTNQGFKSIVPNKGYGTEFIYELLKDVTPQIINAAGGSTFKEISGSGMKAIPIVLPKKEVAKNYCQSMAGLFQSILNCEDEIKSLQQLRDTLLPKLMSGELAVDEVEDVI